MLNCAEILPRRMSMLAGTDATPASELDNVREMPPAGAGPLRRKVPLPFWPPSRLADDRVSLESPLGTAQDASAPPPPSISKAPTSMAAPVVVRASKQVGWTY